MSFDYNKWCSLLVANMKCFEWERPETWIEATKKENNEK